MVSLPQDPFEWSPGLSTHFSQERLRVRPGSREDAVVASAREKFERTLVSVQGSLVGSVAALEHPRSHDALNYGEVFLRDNVPMMLHLLLEGRFDIVRHFLSVCLDLQSSTYQTRGLLPTSFVEENGQLLADCGQRSIGMITSVDASLLFVPDCSFMTDRPMDVWAPPGGGDASFCSAACAVVAI